jgi:hypothetical protein
MAECWLRLESNGATSDDNQKRSDLPRKVSQTPNMFYTSPCLRMR